MSDIHKRVYEILLENARTKNQPSISMFGSGLEGNDVYYSADPTYPEDLENVLTPKEEQKRQLKNNKGGVSVGDLFPVLKLLGLGGGCCENCELGNIPLEKVKKMMEFQNNGEMMGNLEAQELTTLLKNNMTNDAYVEQDDYAPDKFVGGKYCMGFGKNVDGCGGVRKRKSCKIPDGLAEYNKKYKALREKGLTPQQARAYIKKVKMEGGNFWDTIGSIAKTVLPLLPMIL